jgi:peptide/nickel transport system substrate-binding protein
MKRGLALGFALALTLVVPWPANAAGPKQLVISQAADAVTLDAHMQSQSETQCVIYNIYDELVDFTENFEPVPSLATAWKVVDPVTWRFTLRKGVTFHNGEAFNARAVKFSFDRIVDPNQRAPLQTRLFGIKEVKVIDDFTIDMVTKEPYAPLLYIISRSLSILPPDTVKQMGDTKFGQSGIGTGPYRVVKWVKDQELVLEANPKYWKGAPRIQRVVFRPIPEDSARVAALQTGESDLITAVPPDRWKEIQENKATRLAARRGVQVYMGLDTFHPPLNDVRVRRALNHAIDVDTIISKILLGTADRMNGPVQKSTLGYDKSIPPFRYDPALAKKLLAEAGYPNGFETVLSTLPAQEGASKMLEVAETVAYQLGQVGVKVKIDTLEPATVFARYRGQQFKMYFYTWPEFPEPDFYLYTLFHSQARGYYYKNAEADKLLDQGRRTLDPNERRKVYESLHRLIVEDAPWVFLYNQKIGFGVRHDVKWDEPWDYIRAIDADVAR